MEYEKPPQPPPAIVITAPELAGQFGVPIDRAEMVAEARSHAIERIDSFVASLNRAASESSTGYFVADKSLLFRADGDARLATAVTEALRLPDERLLTKASLDALIEANQRSNPDMAVKLAELRDGGSPTIAKGQSFAVRSAEGLRYEMLQNDALADMLRALPERHLNARGRENRDKILVITGHIDAHKEAQALGLEIERGNGSLALRAETGALERIEALSPLLETLKEVADRAKKLSMPEAQLSSIQRIYETARSQSAATAIDASQRASDIAELRGDGELAMRHLSAAEELVRRFAAPERCAAL